MYLMFRGNKLLGIGVRVGVNGNEGVIRDMDMRFITVELIDGNHLLIPISRWRFMKWKIINIDIKGE